MEARVAVLEQIAKQTQSSLTELRQDLNRGFERFAQDFKEIRQDQKTDFRILFGAIITVALGLACLMAHGFHWV